MIKKKNYKIVALGDIHGQNIWKKIIETNKDADLFIFLGDYFDSFTVLFEEQLSNFKEILEYKKENLEKVVLLLGNHDFQYLPYIAEHYSGYQTDKKNIIGAIVDKAIEEGLIKVCHIYDNWIFSHAGITKTWFKNCVGNLANIESSINEMFMTHPNYFYFTEGINHSNYGDDITQSPLWVRPHSLLEDRIDEYKQVVGHTKQDHILLYDVICIDTLEFGNEYLIINNSVPEVGIVEKDNNSNCCDYLIINGRCSNPKCLEMCN